MKGTVSWERERFSVHWFTLQMATTAGSGKAEARSQILCLGPRWQGSKYLGHLPSTFKVHQLKSASDLEQQGLESAPNLGCWSHKWCLTHWTTMTSRIIFISKALFQKDFFLKHVHRLYFQRSSGICQNVNLTYFSP